MFTMVIVDDEQAVINHLVSNFDWMRHGVEVIGSADSGQKAYELIMSKKPDIVITDIRLPEFTGLELIEKIHCTIPWVQFIILSGYDNFSYAQKAIKLNVVDFLVKPVSQQELFHSVDKAIKRLVSLRKQENGIREFLSSGHGKFNQVILERERCVVICVHDESNCQTEAKEYEFFCNYLKQDFKTNNAVIEVYQLLEEILLVLKIEPGQGIEFIDMILLLVQEAYKKFSPSGALQFGISKNVEFSNMKEACQQARQALEFAVFYNVPKSYHEQINFKVNPFDVDYKSITHLLLKTDSFTAIEAELDTILSGFSSRYFPPSVVRIILADMFLYLLQVLFSEWGLSFQKYVNNDILSTVLSSSVKSMNEMRSIFIDVFRRVEYYKKQKNITARQKILSDIQQYIKENLSRPIMLNEIGEQVKLTPSYISSLFKEEMGITITDYITDLRIEKAKMLLKDSHLKISELAKKVGYEEQRYFSQVFKKKTGITPKEFRNICWYSEQE